MGRGKNRRTDGQRGDPPRRGKRRSIRFDALEIDPDERLTGRAADSPPAIHLRKLTLAEALDRLDTQLRAYAAQGRREVLIVHGKGSSSARGIPVLGPAVKQWCGDHLDLVASWSEAPGRWGGAGALVVTLRVGKDR